MTIVISIMTVIISPLELMIVIITSIVITIIIVSITIIIIMTTSTCIEPKRAKADDDDDKKQCGSSICLNSCPLACVCDEREKGKVGEEEDSKRRPSGPSEQLLGAMV